VVVGVEGEVVAVEAVGREQAAEAAEVEAVVEEAAVAVAVAVEAPAAARSDSPGT
jgi:uncharacterized membrane protein